MSQIPIEWKHGVVSARDGSCRFRVWAPRATGVALRLPAPGGPLLPMQPAGDGYFETTVPDAGPGTRYSYHIDGQDRPDPASRCQPDGVHGPSEIAGSDFEWEEAGWSGLDLEQYILYELHVGAFSPEGTFDSVIPRLERLKKLGVTAIELMPVAQFPGSRNWGYDGVCLFAAQNSYGGPAGLKRLVNACHRAGLAVVLDVVYNHLGPEGNYLAAFAPYFTANYRTPWGPAVNFDGPDSDHVRRFFIENALYWVTECRIDALRLDAVHAIHDESAYPFLQELGEAVHSEAARLGRQIYVIPESSLNDARLLRPVSAGGLGLDAQWNDDFHHALRTLLTGDRTGYYRDFGELEQLARAYREGFVFSGQYSPYRRRRHGNSSRDIPARQFVVFSQNHDQIGNRMEGDRLTRLVDFEHLKLAAGAVLLSPFLPMLFMGEEYAETAPFLYFVSHGDPWLIDAVRAGRKEEFAGCCWGGEPPDPQDEQTFLRAKLQDALLDQPSNRRLLDFYCELIRLRKTVRSLRRLSKDQMEVAVHGPEGVLSVRRWEGGCEVQIFLCFAPAEVCLVPHLPAGSWRKILDSSDPIWLGPDGSLPGRLTAVEPESLRLHPASLVVYRKESEE